MSPRRRKSRSVWDRNPRASTSRSFRSSSHASPDSSGSDDRPLEGAAVGNARHSRLGLIVPTRLDASAKDGTFVLNSLPPGDYTLQVRNIQTITTTQDGGNTMVFRAMMMGGSGDQKQVLSR